MRALVWRYEGCTVLLCVMAIMRDQDLLKYDHNRRTAEYTAELTLAARTIQMLDLR